VGVGIESNVEKLLRGLWIEGCECGRSTWPCCEEYRECVAQESGVEGFGSSCAWKGN
jgi:hypothetical protein